MGKSNIKEKKLFVFKLWALPKSKQNKRADRVVKWPRFL